jgi:hypothetical protein
VLEQGAQPRNDSPEKSKVDVKLSNTCAEEQSSHIGMLTINSRLHADASGLRAANQHQCEKRTNTCGRQHVLIASAAGASVWLPSMCW